MIKRKKPETKGGEKWLATYSDTVTLLMCFFVLLYSISSVDAAKWEIIVKSFNPSAGEISQIVTNQAANDAQYDVQGKVDAEVIEDFDEVYYTLKKEIETQNLESDVEIVKGEGYSFITFRNNVFFDGDSYILRDEGKRILDSFSKIVGNASSVIGEIQIMGHTSQGSPTKPNDVRFDRFLASNRATQVLVYIQEKSVIDPSKLVATSFGQFRPISPVNTSSQRAQNRRVEILITKNGTVAKALEDYYSEIYP